MFTLFVTAYGISEANPIMRFSLQYGAMPFLILKFTVVAVAIEFLNTYLKGRSRHIFTLLLAVMSAVVCWHVFGIFLTAKYA